MQEIGIEGQGINFSSPFQGFAILFPIQIQLIEKINIAISYIKIWHDMAEKKYVPGGLVGVFWKFKYRFKPIKSF